MTKTTAIFDAKKKLLEELGWNENPFVKDLRIYDKESFLKYYCPLDGEKLVQKLAFDTKACLLLGPKGVGKTSAMYYAYYNLPNAEFDIVMFKQPPATLDELACESGVATGGGLVGGLLLAIKGALGGGKPAGIKRQDLAEALRRREKKTVMFLDEAHLETNPEMYMEFKYLLDDVPNLRLIISALGREKFPDSLVQLVGDKNIFSRKGFLKEEMTGIIAHRIKAVGGKGTHPFSQGALDEVLTEQNLLSPRYVFDELGARLAKMAAGEIDVRKESSRLSNDDPLVQAARRSSAEGSEVAITKGNADWWVLLSPSQQQVMELLLSNSGLTLADICKKLGLAENTAFNALYQLRGDDKKELERKKEVPFPLVEAQARLVGGRKKNVYFAASKVRNLFTMS